MNLSILDTQNYKSGVTTKIYIRELESIQNIKPRL